MFFKLRDYTHLHAWAWGGKRECTDVFMKDMESNIRFVCAGVILGLQQLHALGIVFRGINFENIIINSNGYPLLTNLSKLHPSGYGGATPEANQFSSPE